MRVTDFFRISGDVQFLDVDVINDSPLFVQPTAIRTSGTALARAAQSRIDSFSGEVLRLRVAAPDLDRARGRRILKTGLNEPHFTRLGFAAQGSYGHGFGPGKGDELWAALGTGLVQEGLIAGLEHLPLFLRGVERDLVSDMTTRLCLPELVSFTNEMRELHPALSATLCVVRTQVWDPAEACWSRAEMEIPVAAGKPLLLVPRDWTAHRLIVNHDQFYNRITTTAVQNETAVYLDGRWRHDSKAAIKAANKDKRKLNRDQSLKYIRNGRNLVAEYMTFAAGYHEPLSAEDALLWINESDRAA